MPIVENDIRFRAAQRMTDFEDGGGAMSSVVIVDGVKNNVFDDITDLQRAVGNVSIRKVFAGAFNNDSDSYLGAHALIDALPTDAATYCSLFSVGSTTTERSVALAMLKQDAGGEFAASADYSATGGTATEGNATATGFTTVFGFDQGIGEWFLVGNTDLRVLVSHVGFDLTFHAPLSISGTVDARRVQGFPNLRGGAARVYGACVLPNGSAEGASQLIAASTVAQIAEDGFGEMVSTELGNSWDYTVSGGAVPVLVSGDVALVHHTASLAPAAVANGQTVNVLRTGLARLRVIGFDGTEHAKFTENQPAPVGVGCTADLAAGTVNFTDVSGMSQPVTVEHRIEEMVGAAGVRGVTVTLNRNLSRAYPAGTIVSSLCMLGDMRGRATNVEFAQSAWTSVWSDAVIGGAPTANYNAIGYPIVCTNKGAVTERWALIFTNSTTFNIVGEQLGQIGSGTTGADCAPINPATGAPYFTIPLAGWSLGWAAGNVERFNTAGANAPIWLARCVAPSLPGTTDSVLPLLRGYVNS